MVTRKSIKATILVLGILNEALISRLVEDTREFHTGEWFNSG